MWKTTFNISEKNRNILKKQNKTLDKTQHLGEKNWVNRTFQITDLVISKNISLCFDLQGHHTGNYYTINTNK